MRTRFIFSIFLIAVFCMGKMNAQIMPAITKVALLEQDRATLDEHLSEYTAFTIDKRELLNELYSAGKCKLQIRIDEQRDWTIDLWFNDMRASDYKQTYISDKGKFEDESYRVNTFKGRTSSNQIARFTIDEDNFFGVILDDKEHYVIRPAKDYTKTDSDENLIVYKNSDVIILENETFDTINDVLEISDNGKFENIEKKAIKRGTPCTYYLEIATDADYEFYWDRKGGNLAKTYNDIFSVLNIVEGIYESTFDLRFIVTYQNVWTTTSNGYPYIGNTINSLTIQFQEYWNNNMTGVSRNIAHLFIGKYLGWGGASIEIGQVNNSSAYAASVFTPDMQYTVTHEIGHLLGADHPSDLGTTNECVCMPPFNTSRSVMCNGTDIPNLWFCQASIDEINPFLASNSTLLTGNFPANLNLTGTINGFNVYQATQKITSNQIINSGYTIYKAPEIELGNGFEVKLGAEFEMIIDDSGCL